MAEPFAATTPRLERALAVARAVHHGIPRKGTGIPYITHPEAVATMLASYGYGEDLVIAGLLHDTVEDAKYGCEVLQRSLGDLAGGNRLPPAGHVAFRQAFLRFLSDEFGPDVFRLVMSVSETKNDGGPRRDWLDRKREQLDHLLFASPEEAALKAADAVDNIECTLGDLAHEGLGTLDRFRCGSLTAWYFSAVAQVAAARMPEGSPLAGRLCQGAEALRQAIRQRREPWTPTGYPEPTVW